MDIQPYHEAFHSGSIFLQNSIAFGKVPRREANSQPTSEAGRQAVSQAVSRASRQADRRAETYSLAFFQLQTTIENIGKTPDVQEQSVVEWSNTRPVNHLALVRIPAGG